ncbi:MAG TPA: hypothetical protein PKY96_11810, partial [Flavobacteriales bacterium]|nr:hypothetical protein [Flavobacteriales bacterium]
SIFTTVIVQENGTVNGNTAINAAGPVVNNGTWNMAASHAITIPAAVSFTNNGLLVWKAGTVTGSLVNNGIVTWTGGTV